MVAVVHVVDVRNIQFMPRFLSNAEPIFQRQIVRILLIVPLYSVTSFVTLFLEQKAAVWVHTLRSVHPFQGSASPRGRNLICVLHHFFARRFVGLPYRRDCYEAYVIYCFLQLCIEYLGGPGHIINKLDGHSVRTGLVTCTCCLPGHLAVGPQFLKWVKRGVIQFVWVKPLMAALTLILVSTGDFHEGKWGAQQGFLWITLIYNISYSRECHSKYPVTHWVLPQCARDTEICQWSRWQGNHEGL